MGNPAIFNGIQLGTEDCWVESSPEPGVDRYIVHAEYIDRAGSPLFIQGGTRATIETIAAYYHDQFKPQTLEEYGTVEGVPQFMPRPTAVSGTLAHSWTSLTVEGLFCTNISVSGDQGHRFLSLEFTFSKPSAVSGSAPATFAGTAIGNMPSWISSDSEPGKDRYVVHGRYQNQAGRVNAEVLQKSLFDSFKPQELLAIEDIEEVPQYITRITAVSGTLVHAATGLSVAGLFCTSVSVNDTGERYLDVMVTLEKPVYETGSSPATFATTNIGNLSSWIETSSEAGREIYTVHARHLDVSGRDTLEVVQNTLNGILQPQPLIQYMEIKEVPQFAPRALAFGGTLTNPDTALSVLGCYCTSLSVSDDGGRHIGIVAQFQKPVAVSGTAVATFMGISIGNEPCWVETEWAPGRVIYTVHGQYTDFTSADRQSGIELLGKTFGDAFKPGELVAYEDGGPSPTYIASPWGDSGTLAHSHTGLSVTDCYCTNISITDTGQRFATLDLTFEKPVFDTGVAEPDEADFTWGLVEIGNQPGTWQETVEPGFIRYVVQTAYNGAGVETYVSTLSESLGLEGLFMFQIPRGTTGNRGLIKSYHQVSGDLTWLSRTVSITDTYPESIEATPLENGSINLIVTFVAVR